MIYDEVRTYLIANMSGKNIRLNLMSDSPADQIVIIPTGGMGTVRSTTVEQYMKILSRNITRDLAESDIVTVYGLLHNKSGILTTPVQIVKAINTPWFVTIDEHNRSIYSCNFMLRVVEI